MANVAPHMQMVTVYAIDGLTSAPFSREPISDLERNRLYATEVDAQRALEILLDSFEAFPHQVADKGIDPKALRVVPLQITAGQALGQGLHAALPKAAP